MTIVEVRCGDDTKVGGNGKKPCGGKRERVKTKNIIEDTVEWGL